LHLVAFSGAEGSVRRTAPQWHEPCSSCSLDMVASLWFPVPP